MPSSGTAESPLLLSILEELPIGVWVARAPGGEFEYANRAFGEILGMSARDDVRVGGYAPVYHIEDRAGRPFAEDRLPFVQALRRRETVVVDGIVIARADGTRVPVRAFGKPLFDGAGVVTHVVVAFRDISAEVDAEAARVVATHKLQTALQHAPIILFASDVAGVVTISEGAGLKAMGRASGELVGQSIREVFKDNAQVNRSLDRALAGESFTSVIDLGRVVLESWLSPLRGPDGEIGGVIGVSTDVTDRLRMQRQMNQAEGLAALGRLAASVAHEINNPLAYALEALRLAGEQIPGDGAAAGPRLEELLREAREGMERVRLITGDLKAFSRADEDARRPQDLGRALAAATKMVATRTGPRARIDLQHGPPATVHADGTRLAQIFVNLVLNAADALPPDGAARNVISIASRLDGAMAVVEVSDNGAGVPAELRDRVFDPFFTTKPIGEGTGLGLFVTRNLVEALGGTIALADAPGGGARFTIRLPTVAAPPAPAPTPEVAPAPAARARARVLIVDDEPQLARLFRASLAADYDVQVFTGGRAALAHMLESPPYDLVLCDLMMADVSGMNVFEELRRQRPRLEGRLVFMTGGVFDPQVADFLAAIPNDCVDKPFDVRAEVRRRLP
ncbi:MAG TPA: ATP-binding protein [Polyangia bacterium]|nr:ATP-binding protein [Polyangia bacterium]